MNVIKNIVALSLCLLILVVGSGFTLHTHECFVKQERATSFLKQDGCDIKSTNESNTKKCCHHHASEKTPVNRVEGLCCKDFTSVFKLDIQEQINDQKIDSKTIKLNIQFQSHLCQVWNYSQTWTHNQIHGPPVEVLILQNHPNYIQSYLI